MNKPVVICIDDEPIVLESLKIELKQSIGDRCLLETAESATEALELIEILQKNGTDVAVAISDYIMPEIPGDELLKRIHLLSPQTLTILLTGRANLDAVANAVQHARLYRYMSKPWESEDLKLTVNEALYAFEQDKQLKQQALELKELNQKLEVLTQQQAAIIAERTAELEQANQELYRLATLDYLTQVANRRRFDECLVREWARMSRESRSLSLIMCDVDGFKNYNDEYGYLAGDDCLRKVAQAMTNVIQRPGDLVARYGGDEFVAILPETDLNGLETLAHSIQEEILQLKIIQASASDSPYVSLSLAAFSIMPSNDLSPEFLVASVSKALRQAKQKTSDRIVIKSLAF